MARYSLNAEPVRLWIVAPVLAAAVYFAPWPPWVVDQFYSRDMYPWLQAGFTSFTNLLPFAFVDLLIGVLLIAVLFRLQRLLHVIRERGVMDAAWEMFRRVVRATSILLLLFLWGWGCNYRRLPLERGFPGGEAVEITDDLLKGAVVDANALAQRLRPAVGTGKGLSVEEIVDELPAAMNTALKEVGRNPLSEGGWPKHSMLLTPFFTRAGITGMVNPFGLEAIVHPDLLPQERPFVVAHEWAHLAGAADEAEANAVGWLACMQGSPAMAYSASLFLIGEAAAGLPRDARKIAMSLLDPGVREDLEAIGRRSKREEPLVQRAAARAFDGILRASHVADGTDSYQRALKLILSPSLRESLSTYGTPKK
jgi:hypothetical protein